MPSPARLFADGGDAYLIHDVIAASQRATVVRATTASGERRVVIKAPTDPDAHPEREATLVHEARVLHAVAATDNDGATGAGVVRCEGVRSLQPDAAGEPARPALVFDHAEGAALRLRRWERDGAVDEVHATLTIASNIARALHTVHEAGYVHRRLSPDHVLVDEALGVTLCGFAGATRRGEPHPEAPPPFDPLFTAPEAQRERSGRFHTRRADVYSFGLLLAFLVTGERPTGDGETPFTRRAYGRLIRAPRGLALLIGRCTQPLQKNRFGRLDALLPYLASPDALPTERSEGFGPIELVAAWANRASNEMPVGRLGPGPLVDRPPPEPKRDTDAIPEPKRDTDATPEPKRDTDATPEPKRDKGSTPDAFQADDAAPSPSPPRARPMDDPLFDGLHDEDHDHEDEPAEGPGPRALRYAIMVGILAFALWAAIRHLNLTQG